MTPMSTRISVQDVADATGVTYRQLDYWTRTGRLHPAREGEGSGYARLWTPLDLRVIRVLVAISRGGGVHDAFAKEVADLIYMAGVETRMKYVAVTIGRDNVPRVQLTKGQPILLVGDVMWLTHLPPLEAANV